MNPQDANLLVETVSRFAKERLAAVAMQHDHEDTYPTDIVTEMTDMGLFGCTISEKYGGLGLPVSVYARIVAAICEAWMSPSGIINSHLIVAACIERFGTEAQKEEWLPKMASGEVRAGLALTEPDAGTDLQGVRTSATRTDGGYVLRGSKMWITNGLHGHLIAVLAKTNTHASPPRRGMSLFLCTKNETFQAVRKLPKLGYRGIDTAELVLDNHFVADDRLVGGEEGQGFYQAVGGLELGRINVAARAVGVARDALNVSVGYAQERSTFGKPIAQHQAIQLKLADMATRVRAAELLTEDAAHRYDTGQRCDMEAGMAKLFASEAAFDNAHEAMRIHGAYGYSKEFRVERLYRDAPLMVIGEGTNEMQRIIIARQLIERLKR